MPLVHRRFGFRWKSDDFFRLADTLAHPGEITQPHAHSSTIYRKPRAYSPSPYKESELRTADTNRTVK